MVTLLHYCIYMLEKLFLPICELVIINLKNYCKLLERSVQNN